jgi:hypothetical protein
MTYHMDIHAVPAYGRDYKSKAEVLQAWETGKDFKGAGGYINKDNDYPGQVWVRYDKLRKIVRVQ